MRITLNGHVVASEDQWLYDWFGIEAFSPATVRRALADNPEGEDLEMELNSGGGSVFAGFELYSLIREAKCRTVAIVQSMAGSAASTVMAACDVVRMSPVAQVMIHLPSSWAAGNQNDMKHEAKVLESITQSILNGYEAKCRGRADRARLDKLIRAESWLTAQEAVELGLADEIMGWEAGAEQFPGDFVNAVGGSIRALINSAGPGMSPGDLLARYEQLVRDGAAPAEGHGVSVSCGKPVPHCGTDTPSRGDQSPLDTRLWRDTPLPCGADGDFHPDSWQVRARLDIEYNRFLEV